MRFDELQARRAEIYALADKYGVTDIRVFGSVARGDDDETSDVDLMIRMQEGKSLFDLLAFRSEAARLLRHDVDVVEIEAIKNPLRKRYMMQDAKPL
jgi:predicted nucleotidyltransferase